MIGTTELLIILLVAFLIFGAKRLPEIGGALGKAIKDFKKAVNKPDEIDVSPKKEDEKKEESDKPEG
jgi:sec-independent protein translocase protein TatA